MTGQDDSRQGLETAAPRPTSGTPRRRRTPYGYRVWATGKTFACHAWSPSEWFRSHGFETEKDAAFWGMDAIVEFGRNDAVRAGTAAGDQRGTHGDRGAVVSEGVRS